MVDATPLKPHRIFPKNLEEGGLSHGESHSPSPKTPKNEPSNSAIKTFRKNLLPKLPRTKLLQDKQRD
jgi:hypothetical protein